MIWKMIIHVNNANYDDNSTEKNESSCERTVEDKKVIISRSEEEEKRSYNSSNGDDAIEIVNVICERSLTEMKIVMLTDESTEIEWQN